MLYGRHLLKQGDYITSINGKSLDRLSSTERDELLESPSTVICIELLRMINRKHSSNGCTGPESSSETREMKASAVEDDWLDRHHVDQVVGRLELNHNELYAHSDSPFRYEQNRKQSRRTLTGKQSPYPKRLTTLGCGPVHVNRSYRHHVEENSSKPVAEKLRLLNHAQASRDPVEKHSASESRKEPGVVKNLPTRPASVDKSHSILDRQMTRHAKGVRFKLSTEDINLKETTAEETTTKKRFSADQQSGKRHKVTATPVRNVKTLPDLTEQIRFPRTKPGTTFSVVLTNGDHKVSGRLNQINHAIKPCSSDVKQDKARSMCSDPVNSSTGLSPHKCAADKGLEQEFWVPSNAPTLKIYTSVISVDSSGNAVITTRVTPSTHQSFLPRQRSVSGPFQISVTQGLTGLGIEVTEESSGMVITGIVDRGPVGKNGNVR